MAIGGTIGAAALSRLGGSGTDAPNGAGAGSVGGDCNSGSSCGWIAFSNWTAIALGAGTVLALTFYIQSYLSILSIKNDCVALRFVADANSGAAWYARGFLISGGLALLALVWPTWVGIRRNFLRWYKASKLPPLQPGHEFDGWSDFQVTDRVTIPQCVMVFLSFLFFFGLTYFLVSSGIGMTPEGVLKEWHYFELQCPAAKPPYQGAS